MAKIQTMNSPLVSLLSVFFGDLSHFHEVYELVQHHRHHQFSNQKKIKESWMSLTISTTGKCFDISDRVCFNFLYTFLIEFLIISKIVSTSSWMLCLPVTGRLACCKNTKALHIITGILHTPACSGLVILKMFSRKFSKTDLDTQHNLYK